MYYCKLIQQYTNPGYLYLFQYQLDPHLESTDNRQERLNEGKYITFNSTKARAFQRQGSTAFEGLQPF